MVVLDIALEELEALVAQVEDERQAGGRSEKEGEGRRRKGKEKEGDRTLWRRSKTSGSPVGISMLTISSWGMSSRCMRSRTRAIHMRGCTCAYTQGGHVQVLEPADGAALGRGEGARVRGRGIRLH